MSEYFSKVMLAMGLMACGCAPGPVPEKPNVVLIVIDTTRADHLSAYGYHRPTSPSIDALAARGTLFLAAHSTASYTRASTASILTGVYPSVHGAITHADSISSEVPTLAERLHEAGYATAGIHRNQNAGAPFGFGRGFETYVFPDDALSVRREDAGRPLRFASEKDDSLLTAEAVTLLERQQTSPFFLYLHFQGAHDPYTPSPETPSFLDGPPTALVEKYYEQAINPKSENSIAVLSQIQRGMIPMDEREREQMVALYDSEIAFADKQVGTVLAVLEKVGHADDTVVIVTADHGEEFWDHGKVSHGHTLFEELIHVPLVIVGPGVHSRRIEEPVSLIDLTPTILSLAGLKGPGELPGRSLVPIVWSSRRRPALRPIYAEGLLRFNRSGSPLFYRSYQKDGKKLILDFEHHTKLLFDLPADTHEKNNLLNRERKTARELLDGLLEVHQTNLDSHYLRPAESVAVPAEAEEDIQALGYLGGQEDAQATDSLFRRRLRRMDLDSHRFLGHELDGASYLSSLDFAEGDFPAEQLLYGWQTVAGRPAANLLRRGAVRLARLPSHQVWRLDGFLPKLDHRTNTVTIRVAIDGGEPTKSVILGGGRFTLNGPLPAGRSFARFDLECDVEFTVEEGLLTNDEAFCVKAFSFGLE